MCSRKYVRFDCFFTLQVWKKKTDTGSTADIGNCRHCSGNCNDLYMVFNFALSLFGRCRWLDADCFCTFSGNLRQAYRKYKICPNISSGFSKPMKLNRNFLTFIKYFTNIGTEKINLLLNEALALLVIDFWILLYY